MKLPDQQLRDAFVHLWRLVARHSGSNCLGVYHLQLAVLPITRSESLVAICNMAVISHQTSNRQRLSPLELQSQPSLPWGQPVTPGSELDALRHWPTRFGR